MPKVSIIIPLHNAEAYITETLQSCFNQTHKNIEVIVVENGSSDSSLEKVQKIKDSRLRIFEIGKASATVARNYGFKQSNGDYIQYLDADDLISSDKVENQVELIEKHGNKTIISCGWAKFVDNITNAQFKKSLVWKSYEKPIEWLLDSWTGGGMMQTACWLTHKNLIEAAGKWNEDLKQNPNDDGEFFCRVLLRADRILFDSKSKVYYRIPTANNVSENKSNAAVASLLDSFYSYQKEILKVEKSSRTKKALAHNYSRFIYEFYPDHKRLINDAKQHLHDLGITKPPLVGGQNFKKLARIVGFYNALRLRTWFKF